ncbi:hypothetical protein CBL_10997 [Carabus blaptoides fortunei]
MDTEDPSESAGAFRSITSSQPPPPVHKGLLQGLVHRLTVVPLYINFINAGEFVFREHRQRESCIECSDNLVGEKLTESYSEQGLGYDLGQTKGLVSNLKKTFKSFSIVPFVRIAHIYVRSSECCNSIGIIVLLLLLLLQFPCHVTIMLIATQENGCSSDAASEHTQHKWLSSIVHVIITLWQVCLNATELQRDKYGERQRRRGPEEKKRQDVGRSMKNKQKLDGRNQKKIWICLRLLCKTNEKTNDTWNAKRSAVETVNSFTFQRNFSAAAAAGVFDVYVKQNHFRPGGRTNERGEERWRK